MIALILTLIVISFAEYAAHRWIMHKRVIDFFWHEHTVQHHGWYYEVFDHEDDPEGKYVNLKISWASTILGLVLVSPIWFVWPLLFYCLVPAAFLHNWLWRTIHSEMHLNQQRFFSNWRIFRWFKWYHFMHHQQPSHNFNVTIPLFDWVFRTRAKVRIWDEVEWSKLTSNKVHQCSNSS